MNLRQETSEVSARIPDVALNTCIDCLRNLLAHTLRLAEYELKDRWRFVTAAPMCGQERSWLIVIAAMPLFRRLPCKPMEPCKKISVESLELGP